MVVQQTQQGHQSTITVEIEVDRSVITDPKQTHTANPPFFYRNSRKSLDSATTRNTKLQQVEKCKKSRIRNRSRRIKLTGEGSWQPPPKRSSLLHTQSKD